MSELRHILAERRSYPEVACTHAHAHAQLLFPLQGTTSINTDQPHQLNEQHLLFLPPHCPHTYYGHDLNQTLVLDVPDYFCRDDEMRRLKNRLCRSVDERWQAVRFLLQNEVADKPTTHQAVTDLFHYAYHLLL